jgi:hypothetical protein
MLAIPMPIFIQRIIRAARLDSTLYEEVEADRRATLQALGVVVLSGLAAGIGTIGHFGDLSRVPVGIMGALIGWLVWAAMTYWIGAHLLPEPQTRADLGELLRTTGFAMAPGLLRVAGVVPMLTDTLFLISSVWTLVAMVVAVRQALDYQSTWRAVAVCGIGWFIQVAILLLTIRAVAGWGAGG